MANVNGDQIASRLAGSALGVWTFRALLTIAIVIGGYFLKDVLDTVRAIEERVSASELKIVAIESRRDAASKARDEQLAALILEMQLLRQKIDLAANQLSGLAAKVEILLQRADTGDAVVPPVRAPG